MPRREQPEEQPAEQPAAEPVREQVAAAEEIDARVQEAVDDETERGYVGERVDTTPYDHYTVEGVTSGKPTPETDAGLAREVEQRARDLASGRPPEGA